MAKDQWGELFKRLDKIEKKMATKDDLLDVQSAAGILESRFNMLDSKVDRLEEAMESGFAGIKKALDEHGEQLEGIASQLKKVTDDKPFTDERISRVEFRTKKVLGKKLSRVDAEFEKGRGQATP